MYGQNVRRTLAAGFQCGTSVLILSTNHIFAKGKQLGLKFPQMYLIVGRKSELSIENKLPTYKTTLKPIWTYGVALWGAAGNSNNEILQRYQNKVFRAIVNAPSYVTSKVLHAELKVLAI